MYVSYFVNFQQLLSKIKQNDGWRGQRCQLQSIPSGCTNDNYSNTLYFNMLLLRQWYAIQWLTCWNLAREVHVVPQIIHCQHGLGSMGVVWLPICTTCTVYIQGF